MHGRAARPAGIGTSSLPAAARRRASRSRPPRGAAPALTWNSPERHLWVATRDGEYAGMTVFDRRRGFTSTGPRAQPVGSFRSLEAAQEALEPRG
jgi:hypothetical protein